MLPLSLAEVSPLADSLVLLPARLPLAVDGELLSLAEPELSLRPPRVPDGLASPRAPRRELVAAALPEAEAEAEALGDALAEADALGLALALALAVGEALAVALTLALAEGEADAVGAVAAPVPVVVLDPVVVVPVVVVPVVLVPTPTPTPAAPKCVFTLLKNVVSLIREYSKTGALMIRSRSMRVVTTREPGSYE